VVLRTYADSAIVDGMKNRTAWWEWAILIAIIAIGLLVVFTKMPRHMGDQF
jgi:hypothetical protein